MHADFIFDNIVTQIKLGGTSQDKIHATQLQSLDINKLYNNGFRNWDGTMVLLPGWILPYVADGSELRCIDGTVGIVGVDYIDDDTRGGCIAYGIERSDIPDRG